MTIISNLECQECRTRCYPEDPAQPFWVGGRYMPALCQSCNAHPGEIEEHTPDPEWGRRQWDILDQLRAEVRGWREKHAEILLAYDKVIQKKQKGRKDRI